MMRRILVDYARSRNYAKRGGGAAKVSLDEALIVSDEPSVEVVNVAFSALWKRRLLTIQIADGTRLH